VWSRVRKQGQKTTRGTLKGGDIHIIESDYQNTVKVGTDASKSGGRKLSGRMKVPEN